MSLKVGDKVLFEFTVESIHENLTDGKTYLFSKKIKGDIIDIMLNVPPIKENQIKDTIYVTSR